MLRRLSAAATDWCRGLPPWQIAHVFLIGFALSHTGLRISCADEIFADDPPAIPNSFEAVELTTQEPAWSEDAAVAPQDMPSCNWASVPEGPVTHNLIPAPDCHVVPRGAARYYLPVIGALGLRHSSTTGRNVGLGWPLVGTSWLNRPYYFGGEIGTLWMTRGQDDSVGRDTDAFGGFYFGWDWDYYWATEFRFDWATPELINSEVPDADRTDSLFVWSYSQMYYPWGDSVVRPYWRLGIGTTSLDIPLDNGYRTDGTLLTFPIGIGVKYPLQRWLAARMEFTDHFAIGSSGFPTQHNLTLTFGLELRYGIHPKSYWPWYPSRHMW